ncbi:TonB-dependent receptor [Pedobacter gandavensis]|uniref:TonB-dependent receptor n=1 Tax=Pedobacter gandavensis TaxID=2679963 RepID=A0ABR6EXU3_9SPHI|nr:TonB-dependent receptor [Pedobacter gandavensis]MBB2150081.1 TonB-dependent receptor [Pedobacter gandavensis]
MGILCASVFYVQGQKLNKSSIRGQVSDDQKEGIPTATIRLMPINRTQATDQKGIYDLSGLPAGNYIIQITAIGFKKIEHKISLQDNQDLRQNFSMKESQNELSNVSISGKTESRKAKEAGFAVNSIDLKPYANTTNDLNQILNRSAGVKVREQGGLGSDFEFSINGLSGGHIKFFIDGIPMESYGSGMTLNNFPVNLAERVEVYKGVVPAYLGSDALGGAVNIITKKNKGKSIDLSYSAGSFNTHRAGLTGSFTDDKTGITTNVSSYYNYSDNNYYMYNNPSANALIELPKPGGFEQVEKLRRFHDQYESFMGQVEAGISNKKWADVFVAGVTYTSNYKQRQTGATQEKVIGKVTNDGYNIIPSIRYRKENLLIKGLSASVFANYSANKNILTDTSGSVFYWDGSSKIRGKNGSVGSELSGEKKSIAHFTGNNILAQLNLGYTISQNHMVNMNNNYNSSYRESYNEIDPYNHTYDKSNRLNKNITGISYQQQVFNGKMTNNFFGKMYGLSGKTYDKDGNASNSSKQYYGYGLASSYRFSPVIGMKASYEHAYRLPGLVELFGDREVVKGNPNLKPENSNNYNLGLFFDKSVGKGKIWAEASAYYRDANDYISTGKSAASNDGSYAEYSNTDGIIIRGFETEVRYDYNNLFSVLVNMTYQSAVNRQQFAKGSIRESANYLSRVPNEPWLYGNADFSIGKDNLIGKDTRVQFNWFSQFINDYSVNWSKMGSKDTKDYIPRQFIHNATLTYSMHKGRYNVSLESRNLTNVIAYDKFKLQKPGTSFFIKLRYAISQFN